MVEVVVVWAHHTTRGQTWGQGGGGGGWLYC